MSNTLHEQQHIAQTDLNTIFTHFSSQDIEDFYQLYQLWSLQQRRTEVVARIRELEQQIAENEAHLNVISPSPIALATLSLFRAIGVDDIDLLDCMLERGDTWLDHALQLFLHCERLDVLEGNATQWCRHALEGAYDWIGSMADINMQSATDDTLPLIPVTSSTQALVEIESLPEATEEDFLKKLLSEDEESVKESSIPTTSAGDTTLSLEGSIAELSPVEAIPIEQAEDTTEPVRKQISTHEEIEYTIPTTLPEAQPVNDLGETAPEDLALDYEQITTHLEAISPSIASEAQPVNNGLIETAPEDLALDYEQITTHLEAISPSTASEAQPVNNGLIETAPEDLALDYEQETTHLEAISPSIASEAQPVNDLIETTPEDLTLDYEQETTHLEAISPSIANEDTATQPEEQIDPPSQLVSFPEQVLNAEQIAPSQTEQYQQTTYATRKRSKAYSLKSKKEPKKHRFHQSKRSHKKKK